MLSVLYLALCCLLVVLFCLVCLTAGGLLARLAGFTAGSAACFASGHLLVCIMLQCMALAGLIAPLYLAGLALGIMISGYRFMPLSRDWRRVLAQIMPESCGIRLLACGMLLITGMLGLCALSYPQTDALAYYMAQAKLIAFTGSFAPLREYTGFTTMPLIAEMPFVVMYSLAGEVWGQVAAKLSVVPVLAALLCLLWSLARALDLSREAAWFAVALGVTSTAVTLVAWDGKTDLVSLMYAVAAVLVLPGLRSNMMHSNTVHSGTVRPDPVHTGQAVLFGLLSAGAVAAKFSYALVLPLCLGIPFVRFWWGRWAELARLCAVAGVAAACLFAVAWWGKNAVVYGDPLAPLLVLRAGTPSFGLDQVWFGPEQTQWIVGTYPLAVTFGMYPMQHGGLSPLWLMLLPALAQRPWQGEGHRALWLALGGLAGLAAWVILRPSVIAPRYFFPALLLPCFLLLRGYDGWRAQRPFLAALAGLALAVLLLLHGTSAKHVMQDWTRPYLNGVLFSRWERIPHARRAFDLRQEAGAGARYLLLSYSSENLPAQGLRHFHTLADVEGNIYDWSLRNNIDFIIHDAHTHKVPALDLPPPPGLNVEKVVYAPDVYILYKLTRITEGNPAYDRK